MVLRAFNRNISSRRLPNSRLEDEIDGRSSLITISDGVLGMIYSRWLGMTLATRRYQIPVFDGGFPWRFKVLPGMILCYIIRSFERRVSIIANSIILSSTTLSPASQRVHHLISGDIHVGTKKLTAVGQIAQPESHRTNVVLYVFAF